MCSGCRSDPESDSGQDAYRHQAQALSMDEWTTDDISGGGGDRTDWRFVDLAVPGRLRVIARVDEEDTRVKIGIYDRYGASIQQTEGPSGLNEVVATVDVVRAERIFIMVQATGGPASTYSLYASLGDGETSVTPRPGF